MTDWHLPAGLWVRLCRRRCWRLRCPALVAGLRWCSTGSPVGTLGVPAASGGGSATSASGSGERTSVTAADLPLVAESAVHCSSSDLIHTRHLALILTGGILVLLSLRVAVEVQISHDIPLSLAVGKSAAETEDLTGQHPPDQTDGVTSLVVGWNGNIDVLGGRLGIAESDDWNVDVACLLDSLSVGARVGDDDETGLLERASDVVGEVTRGETTSDGSGTGVRGELQNSALTVRTGRDGADVCWVVDCCDDASCEDDFLPGLT